MMKKNKTNHVKNKLVLISSFFLFQSLLISAAEIPSYFTDKIFEIPDLCQADKRAGFPEGGKEYCCVVAVSNSLMWLGKHGYPQLVDNGKDDFETQVRLINVLASSEYMNTDPLQGTGTQNIIRGLRKYIESKGCSIRRLDYQGWRKCPDDMKVTDEIPGLRWIQEGLYPDGCVTC